MAVVYIPGTVPDKSIFLPIFETSQSTLITSVVSWIEASTLLTKWDSSSRQADFSHQHPRNCQPRWSPPWYSPPTFAWCNWNCQAYPLSAITVTDAYPRDEPAIIIGSKSERLQVYSSGMVVVLFYSTNRTHQAVFCHFRGTIRTRIYVSAPGMQAYSATRMMPSVDSD